MILHNGQPPLKARAIVRDRAPAAKPKQPEPALPSKPEMARNVFIAGGLAIRSGFKKVSELEQARRMEICRGCEFFRQSDERCSKCGCNLNWKSRLSAWHCPIEKW